MTKKPAQSSRSEKKTQHERHKNGKNIINTDSINKKWFPPTLFEKKWFSPTLFEKKWFPPTLFFLLTLLYFAPYLGFNKIIMGPDDGARGWHTVGGHHHVIKRFSDKWSPLNGGTAVMERRFGRFINPVHPFYMVLQKYKARTIEYMFWTFIAGFFMFLFLKSIGISKNTSYICGIAFMFAPAFQSYIFAGHFARMEVIALMPGVMFFTERMLQKVNLINLVGLAIILSLSYYSQHPQLAYYVCLGMAAYFSIRMIHMVFKKKEITVKVGIKRTGIFALSLVIAVFLLAMNVFPTIEHVTKTSERAGGVDYEYAASFSLHPEEMFNLFQPDFTGWKEYYWGQNILKLNNEYFGVCFLLLAVMLFLFKKQDFNKFIYVGLFVFAVLFTLGAHTPLHRIIYHTLPGMKSFRGPSFMYIWFFFSGLVLAAYALDELVSFKWSDNPDIAKRFLFFAGVVAGLAFIYMAISEGFVKFWYNSFYPAEMQSDQKFNVLTHHMKNIKIGAGITFFLIIAFFTISYLKAKDIIDKKVFFMLFLAIILIDLIRISRPFLTECTKPQNYFTKREKWEQSFEGYLRNHLKDKSIFRIHHMFGVGDMKMYIPELELLYVFDDFTNQRYNDIVQIVRSIEHAITDKNRRGNISQIENSFINALSILNTKYIFSFAPIPFTGLQEITNSNGLRIYKNPFVFPRFFLTNDITSAKDPKESVIQTMSRTLLHKPKAFVKKDIWKDIKLSPSIDTSIENKVSVITYDIYNGYEHLQVTSEREQLLVASENYNTGWKATVDDKPAEVIPVNYYAKGIIVPRGKSHVKFTYNSPTAVFWRKVTLFSMIIFVVLSLFIIVVTIKKPQFIMKWQE